MPRLALLTGGLCAALVLVLGFELRPMDEAADVPAHGPAPAAPTEAAAAQAPPVDAWTQQVLARPLFSPDRRPAATAQGGKAGLPRLAGTIRDGAAELAIFQPASGRPLVLDRGAMLAEWTVADIADGTVTLQRGASVVTLHLGYANLPIAALPVGAPAMPVLHDKRSNPFLQP